MSTHLNFNSNTLSKNNNFLIKKQMKKLYPKITLKKEKKEKIISKNKILKKKTNEKIESLPHPDHAHHRPHHLPQSPNTNVTRTHYPALCVQHPPKRNGTHHPAKTGEKSRARNSS
jgi:hypothetical protein